MKTNREMMIEKIRDLLPGETDELRMKAVEACLSALLRLGENWYRSAFSPEGFLKFVDVDSESSPAAGIEKAVDVGALSLVIRLKFGGERFTVHLLPDPEATAKE